MLDILLLVFFGFRIHRLATEKGLSSRKWIMNFVLSYFIISLMIAFSIIIFLGAETFTDPEKLREIAPYLPLTIVGVVALFYIFQYKLKTYPDAEYYDEDPPSDSSSNDAPKKDLSYFR
jgi:polyferredoxin